MKKNMVSLVIMIILFISIGSKAYAINNNNGKVNSHLTNYAGEIKTSTTVDSWHSSGGYWRFNYNDWTQTYQVNDSDVPVFFSERGKTFVTNLYLTYTLPTQVQNFIRAYGKERLGMNLFVGPYDAIKGGDVAYSLNDTTISISFRPVLWTRNYDMWSTYNSDLWWNHIKGYYYFPEVWTNYGENYLSIRNGSIGMKVNGDIIRSAYKKSNGAMGFGSYSTVDGNVNWVNSANEETPSTVWSGGSMGVYFRYPIEITFYDTTINAGAGISEYEYHDGYTYWVRAGNNFKINTSGWTGNNDSVIRATQNTIKIDSNGSTQWIDMRKTSSANTIQQSETNGSGHVTFDYTESSTDSNGTFYANAIVTAYGNQDLVISSMSRLNNFNYGVWDTSKFYKESAYTGQISVKSDSDGPKVSSSVSDSNWTNQNVNISLSATDNRSGVKSVNIYDDGWGVKAGGTSSTNHNVTEEGNQNYRLKAVDNVGNETHTNINVKIDKTPPTVTSVEIKNITDAGYDVYAYGVSDSLSGVKEVKFPTWTTVNGQDDITWHNGTNMGNGTWYYRVNTSDHWNQKSTNYHTHIYAYDNAGNNRNIGEFNNVYVPTWTNPKTTENGIWIDTGSGPGESVYTSSDGVKWVKPNDTFYVSAVGRNESPDSQIDEAHIIIQNINNTSEQQIVKAGIYRNTEWSYKFWQDSPPTNTIKFVDGNYGSVRRGEDWSPNRNGKNIESYYKMKLTDDNSDYSQGSRMLLFENNKYYWSNGSNFDFYNTIKTDGTAPTVTFSPNSKTWTNSSISVIMTPSDTRSGVKRWRVRYSKDNGTTWGEWNSYMQGGNAITTTLNENAQWKIQVELEDNVGNSGTVTSGTYQIDKEKPNGVFSPNSKSWTNANITVSFDPSDNLSGVQKWRYSISTDNGNSYGSWSDYIVGDTTRSITLISEYLNKIKVEVIDNANNTNTLISGTYQIDKTAPTAISYDVVDRQDDTFTIEIVGVTDNNGSGVKSQQVKVWVDTPTGRKEKLYTPIAIDNNKSRVVVNRLDFGGVTKTYYYELILVDNVDNSRTYAAKTTTMIQNNLTAKRIDIYDPREKRYVSQVISGLQYEGVLEVENTGERAITKSFDIGLKINGVESSVITETKGINKGEVKDYKFTFVAGEENLSGVLYEGIVDYNNIIYETNETDNSKTTENPYTTPRSDSNPPTIPRIPPNSGKITNPVPIITIKLDLVAEYIDIVDLNSEEVINEVITDDSYRFKYKIKNNSSFSFKYMDVINKSFFSSIFYDGNTIDTISINDMSKDEIKTFYKTYKVPLLPDNVVETVKPIRLDVDTNNIIKETDENNNSISRNKKVIGLKLTDYRITNVVNPIAALNYPIYTASMPLNVKAGYNVTFKVNVTGKADSVYVNIKDSNGKDYGKVSLVKEKDIDSIRSEWSYVFAPDIDTKDNTIIITNLYSTKNSFIYNYNLKESWNGQTLKIGGNAREDVVIYRKY